MPNRELLILSPHLDDAVLSVGALAADAASAGDTVTIVTVFAGRPVEQPSALATRIHGEEAFCIPESRRLEDRAAIATIGAQALHLDYLEAVYRQTAKAQPVYGSMREVLAGDFAQEAAWVGRLAHGIKQVRQYVTAGLVFAPAGIGGHVDHLLVRELALQLISAKPAGKMLWLYEDLPYAMNVRCSPPHPASFELVEAISTCSRQAWSAKLRAINEYRSQAKLLHNLGVSEVTLRQYAMSVGSVEPGERLWLAKLA